MEFEDVDPIETDPEGVTSNERPDQPPSDTRPDDATDEAPYGYTASGRIRKRPVGTSSRSTGGGGSPALARQAAATLSGYNRLAGIGLAYVGLVDTGGRLTGESQPGGDWESRVAVALESDPKLCKQILKGGGTSAKMALVLCYGELLATVGMIGVMEYRAKKEAAGLS